MKLSELYTRVTETTGLEVLTAEAINAAIANCFADLTSRGYREFEELSFEDSDITVINQNFIAIKLPDSIRKINYCRIYFETDAAIASRIPIGNKLLESIVKEGIFVSNLWALGKRAIYYTKGSNLLIEWLGDRTPSKIVLGIYKRLVTPTLIASELAATGDLSAVNINIRKEFEDALVLYACYFFYARELKDTERMQFHLNQYKYYVEDILHELSEEDNFDDEDDQVVVE